jgi:sugar (pentulose or hexulose) kinase
VVGGGAQNELLNALTVERAHVAVSRGAVEAAILGNVQNQLWALRRTAVAGQLELLMDLGCTPRI